MLTNFQCETIAYELDGELLCVDCAEADAVEHGLVDEDGEAERVNVDSMFVHHYGVLNPERGYVPVIRYALDEYQAGYAEDEEDRGCAEYEACLPAIECERCYGTIMEEYVCSEHDGGYDNRPVPRWTPCTGCGARDGEAHRENCPEMVRWSA